MAKTKVTRIRAVPHDRLDDVGKRVGNTLIDSEHFERASLPEQLEAIADLTRLLELVEWGLVAEAQRGVGELVGDETLRLSIVWPLRTIAQAARDRQREHGTA